MYTPPPPPTQPAYVYAPAAPANLLGTQLPTAGTDHSSFYGPIYVGTRFPLIQSPLNLSTGNNSRIELDPSVGPPVSELIVTQDGWELPGIGTIPFSGGEFVYPNGDILTLDTGALNYLLVGNWHKDYLGAFSVGFSWFTSGFATAKTAVPIIGNATYSLKGGVLGNVFVTQDKEIIGAYLEGDDTFTVTFNKTLATTFTGTISNAVAIDENGNVTAWNSATISGGYNYGTGTWGGTITTTSAPATPFALKNGATGVLIGNFFGPNAEEVGGTWTLSNNDGTGAAEGIIGGEKEFPFTNLSTAGKAFYGVTGWLGPNWSLAAHPVVGTPAIATGGTNPVASPQALPGGPKFTLAGPAPNPNTVFPFTMTSMTRDQNGLSANPAINAAGGSFTLLAQALGAPNFTSLDAWLDIPALGIHVLVGGGNQTVASGTGISTGGPSDFGARIFGLDYTAFGTWDQIVNPNGAAHTGVFTFGYETPSAALPTSGSATYSGPGLVVGNVYSVTPSGTSAGIVTGDASFNANFATGNVSGTFSHMLVTSDGTTAQPWNDVSVAASIASGTSRISGTTATTSAPLGTNNLKATATGHIDGGFYGPAANELGAVWTLSNNDGTGAAVGVVGATKQ